MRNHGRVSDEPHHVHRRGFLGALGGTVLVGCGPLGSPSAPETAAAPTDENHRRIEVGGSVLDIVREGRSSMSIDDLAMWVRRSATLIADYYGGTFPVPGLEITLVASRGSRVGFGQHQDGRWIRVRYGREITTATLANDWVMVHEMLHATFPDLPDEHRWMQEGLSTYLEPIVRARGGATTDAEVWRRWTANMHHGRPDAGDRGLDHTHSWGSTYWGGTLFWFAVDVRLREASAGKRSIRDVVTHIAKMGGNGRANWSTAQVVEQGDRATGTTIVSAAYDELARAPGDVDLDALWARLGVIREGERVRLDDAAPDAALRRAITSA